MHQLSTVSSKMLFPSLHLRSFFKMQQPSELAVNLKAEFSVNIHDV